MAAKTRYLTKSRFKLGRECGTKLYYTGKKTQYEDQSLDDSFLQALASGGFQVGELAKIYHPNGRMIDTLDYDEAWKETERLLKLENVTIYEAAFRFDSLFVRVDVLVKNGEHVKLIDVKSKSFDPTEEDPFYDKVALKRGNKKLKSNWLPYLEDVAFQTYVARNCRPDINFTPYMMFADKSKVTSVSGLNQNFLLLPGGDGRQHVKIKAGTNLDSVGDQILCRICVADEVALIHKGEGEISYGEIVAGLASAYVNDTKIAPQIGTQCKSCEFRSDVPIKSGFHQCWREAARLKDDELVGPFVFDVWNFRKASALIESGTYLMRDIPVDELKSKESEVGGLSMADRQRIQIEAAASKSIEPYIDREGLTSEISSWRYPLHFIDFETTMVAIPFNSGRRPYEQIAFQFSHHQVESDGTIRHQGQYINQTVGAFPNFEFLRALKRELEKDQGTIFRYAAHENTVLCQIYDQLEFSNEPDKKELQDWIRTITTSKSDERGTWDGHRSMVDMCELVKRYYYHPMTNGSNSIKKVLPATLHESRIIKERYSKSLYGSVGGIQSLNFKDWTWVQFDAEGKVVDPYSLLPAVFNGIDTSRLDLLLGSDELTEGGAAMMAYAKMQFSEMSLTERQAVVSALLKYCELDTFAMVLLFKYWLEVCGRLAEKVA